MKRILAWLVILFCGYKALTGFWSIGELEEEPLAAVGIFLGGLLWAAVCAVVLAVQLSDKFGGLFSRIFYAADYLKEPPDMISPIRGLMANQEYEKAEEELRQLLAKRPYSPIANLLAAEIAIERQRIPDALDRLENYFNNPKTRITEENTQMLLLYSDHAPQFGRKQNAITYLERELARKGYSEPERQFLSARLAALHNDANLSDRLTS